MKLRRCARCGEDHEDLPDTKAFVRPIAEGEQENYWTHWVLCPVTHDPILYHYEEKKETE